MNIDLGARNKSQKEGKFENMASVKNKDCVTKKDLI